MQRGETAEIARERMTEIRMGKDYNPALDELAKLMDAVQNAGPIDGTLNIPAAEARSDLHDWVEVFVKAQKPKEV